ncbi:MAG: hydroxymethylpyrimidine/phosphomethylpyrimidine kinase [Thalassovita sp.]|nr:hydroxymethylpyrimidine/phosphomethylpyrimidine kinase [Thalassovita sp.]
MTATVLFIGGMDSSGGAGILRDTATAAELAHPARVAVTAVTAQSDTRVGAVHPVPPEVVADQIAIAAEGALGAVKIGMLGNRATVEAVTRTSPDLPMVLDPVLASSSGRDLIDAEGLAALLDLLLPRLTLLTPNLPELARLATALGHAPDAPEAEVVATLLARGCGAVLVKGGHGEDPEISEDRLYHAGRVQPFRASRHRVHLRGTGCQLASAIAVHLARGASLPDSVAQAKEMLTRRFARAVAGQG